MKRIVTTKCDGHVEHDRTDVLTEWYNLRMGDNEGISVYSARATKSIERMRTTKVPAAQIPTQEQQAFSYIRGLNSRDQMYAEYKNYLSNALETMKTDYYPKTLTEAFNNASRFHRGTKSDHTPVAPVHSTFTAEEIRTPRVSFTPPPREEAPTRGRVHPPHRRGAHHHRPSTTPGQPGRRPTDSHSPASATIVV